MIDAIRASISKGMHNLISNSPPKTERLLSLFLITVITLLSLVAFLVMTQGLKKDLSVNYVESNTQKALNLAQQIERYFEGKRLQLYDLANSTIVKQTVMNPGQNLGLLADFIQQSTVSGNHYPHVVYNFRGSRIFSSEQVNEDQNKVLEQIESYQTHSSSFIYQHFRELYQGHFDYLVKLSGNEQYWEIALPIKYNKTTEGLFVTYIPVTELAETLKLNAMLNISLRLSMGQKELIWGKLKRGVWVDISNNDRFLKLAYAIDKSSLEDSFNQAQIRLFISLFVVSFIAILLAVIFGRWFFVRPLEHLRSFAQELSEGADPHLEQTKRMTEEMQELSDQITDMAKKIRRREEALMQTNETLKTNQDTLVHAEKMAGLGQVTAGVAHEINNPIGFIMNNLTMLQEYHAFLKKLTEKYTELKASLPSELPDKTQKLVEQVNAILKTENLEFVLNDLACITEESIVGAERVKGITQALKGYAYSGEKTALTDINECIHSTLKMVWNELKYHCKVEKNLAELPQIECMGGQINQVLVNLFVNAAHAMRERNGVLYIETGIEDPYIYILIRDNGCGIKSENLNHIFEPFFTTKAVGEGTGLGMSICYDIIKKHGGSIHVASEVDVGTEFKIKLPISNDPALFAS